MAVLLGSRQTRKIALVLEFSVRSDQELRETVLYDGSISTGSRVPWTIFETDAGGQNGHFLTCLTLFEHEIKSEAENF